MAELMLVDQRTFVSLASDGRTAVSLDSGLTRVEITSGLRSVLVSTEIRKNLLVVDNGSDTPIGG